MKIDRNASAFFMTYTSCVLILAIIIIAMTAIQEEKRNLAKCYEICRSEGMVTDGIVKGNRCRCTQTIGVKYYFPMENYNP